MTTYEVTNPDVYTPTSTAKVAGSTLTLPRPQSGRQGVPFYKELAINGSAPPAIKSPQERKPLLARLAQAVERAVADGAQDTMRTFQRVAILGLWIVGSLIALRFVEEMVEVNLLPL
jgi:hypothetical protein